MMDTSYKGDYYLQYQRQADNNETDNKPVRSDDFRIRVRGEFSGVWSSSLKTGSNDTQDIELAVKVRKY